MGVGGIFVTLRAITSKFQADMSKAKASVDKFRKSTVNVNRQLKRVGKQMSRTGKSMSASLTLPIVAGGALAVKTFADFEQSMAKVKAVSGATGAEFKKLEELAKSLGESTRFTAVQVAELELNYSKLGFVSSEIEAITKPTLDLALATGEDLANSAEVAGSTLRGLGLTAKDMPRVVDVMAKSFSSSALDLESFKEAMKLVAPTAVATGRDMETVTSQLGILANNGIKGSIAGTQLNRVFLELNKQGISLEDAMDKVSNSSNGLATATGLVKDRGAKALLILAKQRKELGPLEQKLRDAEGAAASMAATMDDTLQGSLLKVQSALEGAAIELGQTLAPVIKKVGEFIAEMAQSFSALSPNIKKNIAVIAGIVAVAGPLLVVFGAIAGTVIPALIAGFGLLLSPIGLVIAGISALAIGVTATALSGKGLTEEFQKQKEKVEGLEQSIVPLLDRHDELKGKSSLTKIEQKELKDIIEKVGVALPTTITEFDKYGKSLGISTTAARKLVEQQKALLRVKNADAITEQSLALKKLVAEQKLLLNTLNGTGKGLTGITKKGDEFFKTVKSGFGREAITQQVKLTGDEIANLQNRLSEATTTIGGTVALLAELSGVENKTAKATREAAEALAEKNAESEREAELAAASMALKTVSVDTDEKDAKEPKQAKATSGKELIPLIVQLQRAKDEARLFSEAFTDQPSEALQKQRDALREFIAAQTQANDDAKAAGKEEEVVDLQPQIEQWEALGTAIDSAKEKEIEFKTISEQTAEFMQNAMPSILTSMGEAMGEAIAGGDPSEVFKEFAKGLLQQLKQLGALLISTGVPMILAVATMPEGIKQVAAGTALVAAATAGMAMFAQGGLVFGETMGVMGEGRGTTRSNPEVIAPLDKLKGFLGDAGGSGGGGGTQEFVLRGETLRVLANKTSENRSFTTRQ